MIHLTQHPSLTLLDYTEIEIPSLKQKKEAKQALEYLKAGISIVTEPFSETMTKINSLVGSLCNNYFNQAIYESQIDASSGKEKQHLLKEKINIQQSIQSSRKELINYIFQGIEKTQEQEDGVVDWLNVRKSKISHSAKEQFAIRKENAIKNFILAHRQNIAIDALSNEQINELFTQCSKEAELISQLNHDFHVLLSMTPAYSMDTEEEMELEISHSGYTPFCATITTKNVAMGYSIYILCRSLQIMRVKHYSGENEFPLTIEQLELMHKHLRYMIQITNIFSGLLQAIVGGEDKEFFELGKKKLSEPIRDQEDFNKRSGEVFYEKNLPDRIAISAVGLSKMKEYQNSNDSVYFFLFNQISLYLALHPNKEAIKALFERWYAEEGMKSLNGLNKTFQFDDPWRSALDPLQIMQIAPRMSVYLRAISLFKIDPSQIKELSLEQLLSKDFFRMIENIDPSLTRQLKNEWAANWTQIEKGVNDEHAGLSRDFLISKVDLYQARLYKQFILKCLKLKSPNLKELYNPTEEEIANLYGKLKFTIYNNNQQHKNVRQLFKLLRKSLNVSSPPVKSEKEEENIFQDYAHIIDQLEKELVLRLNDYADIPAIGVYGKEQVDAAVYSFERYVALIVYREQSKIEDEAIINSLIAAAGVTSKAKKDDLREGCGSGLIGRIIYLPSFLVQNVEDDLQNAIRQFKNNCLEAAFIEEEINNWESSMHVIRKEWIAKELGIRHPNGKLVKYEPLMDKMIQKCNAVTIFQEMIELFCSNFYALSKEKRTEEEAIGEQCYAIFEELDFGTNRIDLNSRYRKSGDPHKEWDFLRFKLDLPNYLIPYLIKKEIFARKGRSEGEGQNNCAVQLSTEGTLVKAINANHLFSGGFGKITQELAKDSDPIDSSYNKAIKEYETFTGWMKK